MNTVLFVVEGFPVSVGEALAAAGAACLALTLALVAALLRPAREPEKLAEISGRLAALGEWLGGRQTDLARLMAERMDNHHRAAGETLGALNERLAVIDAAQARLGRMAEEMVSLKDILANKQTRGAYGQGRMETIVKDGLPPGAFAFQATLSNRTRPDCTIRLPGDPRPLVIDAKFPLEGIAEFRRAGDDEARGRAAKRVRADVMRHVQDIADKYLLPGETQDIALMFVPAESVYADLVEHFDELVQRAHRARVVIVSPALLAMAIQVAQSMLRDAAVRDSLHAIQGEIGKLLGDVRRLAERAGKLEGHFRAAQEDLSDVMTSADKVSRRAARVEAMDFGAEERRAVAS